MIITLHIWYANKACPGPYLTRQLPWIANEITKRLSGAKPEKFIGEGSFKPYLVKINASALNIRKGPGTNYPVVITLYKDKNVYTILEESNGPGAKKWGKLKSGIGWISLDYALKV
jgi:hypothetical protein